MKIHYSYKELFDHLEVKDSANVSFHHHLRNGDYVMNNTLSELKMIGVRDLTLVMSAIFPCHEPLVELMKDEVVTNIYASYVNGPVGNAISNGLLKGILTMQTHGGRARSIMENDVEIDVAFIAVSACDSKGNANGVSGKTKCGPLGYAIADIEHAKKVVLVTDTLIDVDYIEIEGKNVDHILVVDSLGDASKIESGTTSITKNPVNLLIARSASEVIKNSGLLKEGMSFQTGAGGTSLAVAKYLKEEMTKEGIKGSFASGGITGYLVDMLEEGLFGRLYDVQSFDSLAVNSLINNENHKMMSASTYANPSVDSISSKLDVVILGAAEIDINFNVNVTTDSFGNLIGGSGGHSDVAEGAKLTIVVTNLVKARTPIVVDEVMVTTTKGEFIDVLVTEFGVAINPRRKDLIEKLKKSDFNIKTIEELRDLAKSFVGNKKNVETTNDVVGIVESRRGNFLSNIYRVHK